jgi:kynurenine formamidase
MPPRADRARGGAAMTRLRGLAGAVLAAAVVAPALAGQPKAAVTVAQIEDWMQSQNNWGRWGAADQLGAVNLITDAKRKQAAALVKTGTVVSLAHEPRIIPKEQPEATAYLAIQLGMRETDSGFTVEQQAFSFHGSSFTHLDALCHGDHHGKLYNGYSWKDTIAAGGCKQLGIDALGKQGVVTRGVLIDMPRLKGVKALPPDTKVTVDDIEAWEKQAGVRIGAGDAIFLHTGRWQSGKTSGYDISVAPWLHRRDVAIVSSDGIQDVILRDPSLPGTNLPLHHYILVALGANILDNADLTAAAETAARLRRWEFMVTIAPVGVPGGTGYPVNPLAIF